MNNSTTTKHSSLFACQDILSCDVDVRVSQPPYENAYVDIALNGVKTL